MFKILSDTKKTLNNLTKIYEICQSGEIFAKSSGHTGDEREREWENEKSFATKMKKTSSCCASLARGKKVEVSCCAWQSV